MRVQGWCLGYQSFEAYGRISFVRNDGHGDVDVEGVYVDELLEEEEGVHKPDSQVFLYSFQVGRFVKGRYELIVAMSR